MGELEIRKNDRIRVFSACSVDRAVKHQMRIQFERRPIGIKENDVITLREETFHVLADSTPLLSIEAGSVEDIKVAYQARSPQASLHMLLRKISDCDYELLMEPHHVDILSCKKMAAPVIALGVRRSG